MTPEMVTDIGRQAIETTLIVSGPILGLALVVGLAVSVVSMAWRPISVTISGVISITPLRAHLLKTFHQ